MEGDQCDHISYVHLWELFITLVKICHVHYAWGDSQWNLWENSIITFVGSLTTLKGNFITHVRCITSKLFHCGADLVVFTAIELQATHRKMEGHHAMDAPINNQRQHYIILFNNLGSGFHTCYLVCPGGVFFAPLQGTGSNPLCEDLFNFDNTIGAG